VLLNASIYAFGIGLTSAMQYDNILAVHRIYEASLIAMHPKTGLDMSKADKDEIADFTKRVFKEQLSEFSEKIKNDSQYKVAWEIYAAAVMAGEFPK